MPASRGAPGRGRGSSRATHHRARRAQHARDGRAGRGARGSPAPHPAWLRCTSIASWSISHRCSRRSSRRASGPTIDKSRGFPARAARSRDRERRRRADPARAREADRLRVALLAAEHARDRPRRSREPSDRGLVIDTGPGLTDDQKQRAFERRGRLSDGPKQGMRGPELYVSKKIDRGPRRDIGIQSVAGHAGSRIISTSRRGSGAPRRARGRCSPTR